MCFGSRQSSHLGTSAPDGLEVGANDLLGILATSVAGTSAAAFDFAGNAFITGFFDEVAHCYRR